MDLNKVTYKDMSSHPFTHKLIITDFDGTLSTPESEIYPEVIEYIHALRKRGVLFSIATGRAYFGHLRTIIQQLDLETPQITYGGAELRDPKTDEIVWKSHVKAPLLKTIADYLREQNLLFAIEKDETIFTNIPLDFFDESDKVRYAHSDTFDLSQEAPKLIVPAIRINGVSSMERLEEVEAFITEVSPDIHAARIIWEDSFGLDVTSATGTKHYGALELMTRLGIAREETIGIGDSFNDFPLLNAVGTSVPMGNAPDELKEFADDITLHRERGGYLAFLKKYFPLE